MIMSEPSIDLAFFTEVKGNAFAKVSRKKCSLGSSLTVKVHLSRNPAEGPVMLSIGIVGVICNILCLAVLQKQQASVKQGIRHYMLHTTHLGIVFVIR